MPRKQVISHGRLFTIVVYRRPRTSTRANRSNSN